MPVHESIVATRRADVTVCTASARFKTDQYPNWTEARLFEVSAEPDWTETHPVEVCVYLDGTGVLSASPSGHLEETPPLFRNRHEDPFFFREKLLLDPVKG